MGPRFLIDDFDSALEELFRDFPSDFPRGGHGQGKGKQRYTFSFPNFPPTNLKMDKDKNLFFEFALAGFQKNEIDISFQGDWMELTITPIRKEEKEDIAYLNRGIKCSSTKNKYYVPQDKYDTNEVKASFDNGLLKVEIPSKEPEKARPIMIE